MSILKDNKQFHGNATYANADIIALAESWAEHMALTFADMKYPLISNTSIGNITYIQNLEETWNEQPNHIPIGIYHDLIDSGVEPTSYNESGGGNTTVDDDVSGFTNYQMFQCLYVNTTEIDDFKTALINNYLNTTSNSQTDVNNLFSSY